MTAQDQIDSYIAGQPEPKRSDMQALQRLIRRAIPGAKLWFLDGTDESGKTVSNPNIGFGSYTIRYADGKTKEFYQAGFSANTSGLSVYIMGIADRKFLPNTYGDTIGKANVTTYCIKFKKLSDIKLDVLEDAIRRGVELSGGNQG